VVHHRLKAEDSPVEALGVLQGPAEQVWDYPLHAHVQQPTRATNT
jgi:hypothetical protein